MFGSERDVEVCGPCDGSKEEVGGAGGRLPSLVCELDESGTELTLWEDEVNSPSGTESRCNDGPSPFLLSPESIDAEATGDVAVRTTLWTASPK